jgi:hypothetical protein
MQELYQKYSTLVTHSWMKLLWEKTLMFELHTVVIDVPFQFPREGDQFLMRVFITAGYRGDTLRRLNRVRISLQVLFLSNVLTASGGKVSLDILLRWPKGEVWSTIRWPTERPTNSDMRLWNNALSSICPSRSSTSSVGEYICNLHRVQWWFWNKTDSSIHHVKPDSMTEDVFVVGRKPNRFSYSHSQACQKQNAICSVQPTLERDHWRLLSTATIALQAATPRTFVGILKSWGNTWLWEHMTVHGGFEWLEHEILEGLLVAVTDGSYIRKLYPHLYSAAFVLECSSGRGRVYRSFLESLFVANAYRGELLGLMAIHLILLSINTISPQLLGSVKVMSDCLGALKRVTYLPPYQIPLRCRHFNVLKTILIHCLGLTFTTYYSHVKAHQDDKDSFSKLSRNAQLNCICDHAAKMRMAGDGIEAMTPCRMFPLEPIGLFVGGQKMTLETGDHIRFWAHRRLAWEYYRDHKILSPDQYNQVDWRSVHSTLRGLPRLFQLWALKHVLGIAGTMQFLSYQDNRSPICLSCRICDKNCKHVARCLEEGWTSAFVQSTQEVKRWMMAQHTHSNLSHFLLRYLRGRRTITCLECATDLNLPPVYREYAASQDVIGWGGYAMGMITNKLLPLRARSGITANHQATLRIGSQDSSPSCCM